MNVVTTLGGLVVLSGVILLIVVGAQKYGQISHGFRSTRRNNGSSSLLNPDGPPVQFILYNRGNLPVNINLNLSLNQTGFNFSIPTKIIIHGYLSSVNEEVFQLPKDAYLSKSDYNIIGLDWSVLCEFEYFSAMRGAQTAGRYLASFLNYLLTNGVNPDDLHLIGHSLGAHVAAMGADNIKEGKVARITGLDPAGPGFSEMAHNLKLDPGDAKLVDVIHTYMRVLSLSEPLGHVDFYPNGGRFQPGCPDFFDIWKVPESIVCNHGRAYLYFVESILNEKAFRCQHCNSVEDAIYGRCFDDSDVYMGVAETYRESIRENKKPKS